MNIRAEQVDYFDARRRDDTQERLFQLLRTEFPANSAHLSDPELRNHCWESMALCDNFGLRDFQSFAWFAATRLVVHPRFYEHPALKDALTQSELEENDRIANLSLNAFVLDWEEAASMNSPRAPRR